MKILHNQNLSELTPETDLLGLSEKSQAIQFFIENLIQGNNIQMIALYGDWGSGKTSIMRDIERNLKANKKFHSVFFEVWKHEKDDNIALSLLNCLTNDIIKDDIVEESLNNAVDLFKSFGSGISLNLAISDFLGGNKAEVKVSAKDMMDKYKELQAERYNKSFLTIQKKFEDQIAEIEVKLLENNKLSSKGGKIVVFLDDLDRCEPDVVLNLLASIKLFYTYGKRLIFVCGVDKTAVQNAVKTKYSKIIKSEEYLEKIFDASFNVPTVDSYEKILNAYFGDTIIGEKSVKTELAKFFNEIGFDRPRHLKKILNKYAILVNFKRNEKLPKNLEKLIPNIITNTSNEGNFFETFLTLYFIILSEFHPIVYNVVKNTDIKRKIIVDTYHKNRKSLSTGLKPYQTSISNIEDNIFSRNFHNISLTDIKTIIRREITNNNRQAIEKNRIMNQFYTLFLSSTDMNSFGIDPIPDSDQYIKLFQNNENQISIDFCQFLLKNFNDFFFKEDWSDYNFQNYFKMIQNLL